jgi:hypothetical protein
MFKKSLLLLILTVACCLSVPAFGDDAPAWLHQAASVRTPDYDSKVSAVVLYKEAVVSLDESGRLVTTKKYAVRILDRDGRKKAIAFEPYLPNFSQVKDLQAWMIAPNGGVTSLDKKNVIDEVSSPDDVYDEERLKVLDGSGSVDTGYVFGYTCVVEDHPLFYQDNWAFQNDLPTIMSRYSVTVPTGWTATGTTFNHPDVTPQVTGGTYTWELNDLAPIPDEPMSPSFANLSPRLAVNLAPPNKEQALNKSFDNWAAVSRWASSLYDPQVIVDDNVAAKARELTAGAKTELDMIRAIGKYVQNMQYIALDIGVGYGNGMRPRPSNEVLSRGYADCKNKANLMRALLKALRIEAYPIAIYSGDPHYVRKEFPSPDQFNHCIIAIKVSDTTEAPTVIKNEQLGRLLIFDPTDTYTRVGDLPGHLQGSYGVIIAGDKGGLATMPLIQQNDMLERTIDISLSDTGEIKGKIHESTTGQASAMSRAETRMYSTTDYRKGIEGWLTAGSTGAKLVDLQSNDGDEKFDLDIAFSAPRYAQLMQQKMLIFKPVFVSRRRSLYLTDSKRANPVELDAAAMSETSTFTLPAGFAVDETPDAANIVTPFGTYTSSYEVKGDKLYFKRKLITNRVTVPADKYDSVRSFFVKIRDAEQTPVVLVKK